MWQICRPSTMVPMVPAHLVPARPGLCLLAALLLLAIVLYTILLHLAILAASRPCEDVVWDISETVLPID